MLDAIRLEPSADLARIAYLLGDLPVQILGRMRSDRVLRRPTPPRMPQTAGRPPKHDGEFVFADSATWGAHQVLTSTQTRLYGTATADAWDRLHPRLTRRAAWHEHDAALPVIEGTVIRLRVDRLPSGGEAKPVWLWWSRVDATKAAVDRCRQMFYAVSISNTPSGCSSRPSAGPHPGCATRTRPTAGHG